jgi:hypothetical protein
MSLLQQANLKSLDSWGESSLIYTLL